MSRASDVPTARRASPALATAAVLGLALVMLAGPGCASDPTKGYSARSVHRTDLHTIAIPIFESDSFVRGVEFELTDAVIKEVQVRTPYRISSQPKADSILVGHIRDVDLRELSASPETGLGEEVIVSMTIDFEWRSLATDETLVERKSFSGHGLFVPSTPSGERVELGRTVVVQRLARDIVDEMQAAW